MNETGLRAHDDRVERLATQYSVHDTGKFNVVPIATQPRQLDPIETGPMSACRNTMLFSGGGGLIGTIDDYAKFTEMLLRGGTTGGNHLVSQHLGKAMLRNQLPSEIAEMGPTSFAEQPMKGMGFDLGVSVLMDQKRAQIPGCIGGFSWFFRPAHIYREQN